MNNLRKHTVKFTQKVKFLMMEAILNHINNSLTANIEERRLR